jgi:heme-degrading monooxygenase HmoA
MIIREWRGRALPSRADVYPAHFRSTVLPELLGLSGFLGAHLGQRRLGDHVEFLVLTRWQSMDAIRGFAGNEITRAVVDAEAATALVDFDANVQHYDVIEDVTGSRNTESGTA